MILNFPNFVNLNFSLKEEVEAITSRFEPYSDFNFISLFSWNTDESTQVSLLNGNLVISLPDYITGHTTYSIIGANKIDESLGSLRALTDKLTLVPESTVKKIVSTRDFSITEDEDNFDYIYSIIDLIDLPSNKYRSKRKSINKFGRAYGEEVSTNMFKFNEEKNKELKELFSWWSQQRDRTEDEVAQEKRAIERILSIAASTNLIGVELKISGSIIGFSINEIINQDNAICHFQKTILSYDNADVFLTNQVSKILGDLNCKYVNWEQDLGLPGLRKMKLSYKPAKFLKKYTVRLDGGS